MSDAKAKSVRVGGQNGFLPSLPPMHSLIPNITAGAMLAVLNVVTAVSIGTLVFSGPLSGNLTMGIGLFLIATVVAGLLTPVFSGYKAILAAPRSGQAPIFAVMAAAVATKMDGAPPDAISITVAATILTATIAVGATFFILGQTRLGSAARFIPYPVMGGFFAGLGYLILTGGMSVALGPTGDLTEPTSVLAPTALLHLAPGIVFALGLLLLEKKISHWALLPAYLLAAIAIFYVVLAAQGGDTGMATQQAWLPRIEGLAQSFFPAVTPQQIAHADWAVVVAQSGTILALALLSVMMVLIDVAGIELFAGRDLEPNKELRAAGITNLIGGFLGSPLAFQAVADTTFVYRLGGRNFVMILVYAALVSVAIAIGPAPVSYVPSFVVGGLLIYIGISFLIEWVWRAYFKLTLPDFAVVLSILIVVGGVGILEGVGVGIALSTLFFVHQYSQLSNIKATMTGREHSSIVDHHPDDRAFLDAHGDSIHILLLQGFLFFGSSARLLDQIKTLLDSSGSRDLRFLIVDFQRVDGLDSSAAHGFAKLMRIARQRGLTLVLTGAELRIRQLLEGLGAELGLETEILIFFDDLATGRTWVDDQLLDGRNRAPAATDPKPLEALKSLLGDGETASAILPYFNEINASAGTRLFDQDEAGDALYVILSGTISIRVALPDVGSLTVRRLRSGAVLGEMALYSGEPRSAAADVETNCRLLRLGVQEYWRMENEIPAQAGQLHKFIISLMSERIARSNREILALAR